MKTIKETLIGTMKNGKNILNEIAVSEKVGKDFSLDKTRTQRIVDQLHPAVLNLRISEIIPATKDAKTIRFVSENGYLPPFEAGQYINVAVEIDGVRTTRPYSICSSPRQRAYYEITVARIKGGFVSDYFLDRAKVGDTLQANGPAGAFHFNPVFHYKRSVFLAGGSGITPFMSMIREILERGLDREVHLLYGARNKESAIFDSELKAFAKTYPNFTYTLILSDKDAKGGDRSGFIDANCISEVVKDLSKTTFYLCGPQVMTDFCVEALHSLDVRPRDIRREMFGTRQDIQNEPGFPQELSGTEVFKLKVGDKIIDAKCNESILCALERAGVRVNVCCRSGECSLCRVKLVSGKVFMPRGVLLRHADEMFGYIHSCKAYPIGDVEIAL